MSLYPFLRSPFTDLTGNMFNLQQNPNTFCAKVEMRLYDCLEAYGLDKAQEKCRDLALDFQECAYRFKETKSPRPPDPRHFREVNNCQCIVPTKDARVLRMQTERTRQWFAGERQKHYEPAPRIDAW